MNDSREQILTVAHQMFSEKTYKEVSIQDIVDQVGMTKGAFYYFFKNKEQLFKEAFNRTFSSFVEKEYSQFSHESLYRFYHEYLEGVKNRHSNYLDGSGNGAINMYSYIFDAMKHFPDLQNVIKEIFSAEQKAWEEIVGIARNKGEISSQMTDEQIANVFIFSGDGLGMRGIIYGTRPMIQKNLLSLWDAFYKGLKA